MTENSGTSPSLETMSLMVTSWWVSQIIRTMVGLDLPDYMADGPTAVSELAERTGTHAPTLKRFFRTAAGLGLCATTEDGRVELTTLGALLRSDNPHSMRSYALAMTAPYVMEAWEELAHSLQSGNAAFPHVHGQHFWDYLAAHPTEAAQFDGAMSGSGAVRAQALLTAMNLDAIDTLADIGGGQGHVLAAALTATPALKGLLFDQPQVLPRAKERLTAAGVADRCQLVGGDFFTAVPGGADAYVLAMILHDWPDAEAEEILRVCHRAMAPAARLWIIEQVIPPGDGFHRGKLLDLHMLVLFGAQERTADEHRKLLEAAGFTQFAVHSTDTPYSVIEAVRP